MITPTVGRVVWFWPAGSAFKAQPLAALIAYVQSDRVVNLAIFDEFGVQYARTSVLLHQEGVPLPDGPFCEWMPYQIGQAARAAVPEPVSLKNRFRRMILDAEQPIGHAEISRKSYDALLRECGFSPPDPPPALPPAGGRFFGVELVCNNEVPDGEIRVCK